MQRDDFRAALSGAQPAVDAAWAKVQRAVLAMRAAANANDEGRYAEAWQAWQQASDEYEAAEHRLTSLIASLVPLIVWEEAADAAA
jgi:hypothetical protein